MPDERAYVKLWLSYETYFEPLADAEVGRLVRAMMKYKSDGTEPKFSGNERFTWPSIKRDMDEAERAYLEYRESRAQNGAKGGRPKKAYGFSENQKNHVVFEETKKTIENQGKRNKEQGQRTKDDIEANASCAEPENPAPAPPVICLPLNDGSEYPISQEQCQEWAGLYPAVDVIQQLRGMRGWLLSNPDRKKTRRGILRFITGWLAKEQDRGGAKPARQQASQGTIPARKSFSEIIAEREGKL